MYKCGRCQLNWAIETFPYCTICLELLRGIHRAEQAIAEFQKYGGLERLRKEQKENGNL